KKIQEAEKNKTEDRICAVLRAALLVAIVVGGILGSIALAAVASPGFVILVGLTTLAVSGGLGLYYAARVGCNVGEWMERAGFGAPFLHIGMAISGPGFALYELGKISRYEDQAKEQEIKIQDIRDQIENELQLRDDFYKKEHEWLERKLSEEIKHYSELHQ